jgi:hypothetical protein
VLSLLLPTSMVWANATDNKQVDKPVKPVATISRFAKIKTLNLGTKISTWWFRQHIRAIILVVRRFYLIQELHINFNYNKDE